MRRNEARAEGGVLRRVAAAGVAVLTAATMAVSSPLTALAAEAQGGNSPAVTVNKVATPLDENDQTDVTLSIGSTEELVEANVVFVIDKSTSFDVRDEANKMLDELLEKSSDGTVINVAVVAFEIETETVSNWTRLSPETIDGIKDAIQTKLNESGTNIQAGLAAGRQLLNQVDGHKYLVLLTDGITYQWGDHQTIYTESISNGEESLNAGNEMMGVHHPDLDSYYAEFDNVAEWYAKHGDAIKQDIATYSHEYVSGQIQPDAKGKKENSTYNGAGFYEDQNDYIPGEIAGEHYSSNDAAVYEAVSEWMGLSSDGVSLFAYADTTSSNAGNALTYPWASRFISSLDTVAGVSGIVDDSTVDGMFDGVMNSVLYEIASGTVTDVIGDDFNLTGLDILKMTVGDKTLEGTVSGNTVTFDNGNYVVTYDEAAKTLTWKIGVPVEAANGITLSYNLTLANKEAVAGDYTVPTNESAKLDYTRHDGSTGTATFPVPEVSYSIAAETTGGFTAQKELEGAELTDGEFSFQVKDADGNVIDEATNDADGKIAFGKNMTYSAPGTYEYTISEVLPEDDDPDTAGVQKDDVTYDETVQKVTVDVKLVGNELVATWNLPKDGVKFTNVYTAEEAPAEEPAAEEPKAEEPAAEEPKKDETVPNTGDPTSLMTAGAALVAGVGAAAAGIAVRRRNK